MFKNTEGQSRMRRFARRTPTAGTRSDPPPVTYGKRSKPIQLQGIQFLHSEPEPASKALRPELARDQAPAKTFVPEPDPDDPPLSEDDLEAVYNGCNASPIEDFTDEPNVDRQPGITKSMRSGQGDQRPREASARSVTLQYPKRASRASKAEQFNDSSQNQSAVRPISSIPSQHANQPPAKPITRPETVTTGQRTKPGRSRRHLPVDELVLVASPPSPIRQEVVERGLDVELNQPHDPIANSFSPAHGPAALLDNSKKGAQEASLTLHRKRLITPKFTHKSIADLRKKRRAETPHPISKTHQTMGDGFSSTEIKTGRGCKVKRRKANKTLTHVFEALQLEAGPLPEVEFLDSSCELKLEAEFDEENGSHGVALHHDDTIVGPFNDGDDRKVTFSDRVFEQLSSISAPKRVYSISSDDSHDEQDLEDSEVEDDGASQSEETEAHHEEIEIALPPDVRSAEHIVPARTPRRAGMPATYSRTSMHSTAHSNGRAIEPATHSTRHSAEPSVEPVHNSGGITLDFRHVITPGTRPIRVPLSRQRLMEVDDMVVNDPFVEQQETRDLPSDPGLLNITQPPSFQAISARRPRSILRNHTPNAGDGMTGREFTSANTRRNSVVTTEDSHYFSTATGMLNHRPNHGTTKSRRIVTQLANDSAALDYFARQRREVQIVDSETAIPESSLETRPRDYATNMGMRRLPSPKTASSSSEVLPGVPKDLKSLTRHVSRGNGTLSQAVRRRPSLPFQSPTKVRRQT